MGKEEKSRGKTKMSFKRDRQVFLRFFTEDFYIRRIRLVTDSEIATFVNRRSKELHLKERALKDSLQILNRIFDYAMRHEKIINENPVMRVDLKNYYQNCDVSVKTSDEKIFTPKEIEDIKLRIRKEMSEKDYDIIGYAMLFSIETGVRAAEIPTLRWADISEKGIHIHRQQRITRKTKGERLLEELPYTKNERKHPKNGRYFPLTDAISDILKEIKQKQEQLGIESDFIFCCENGEWFNKETYEQRLRRMCRRMGLSITNNHAFRMSLNSNVLIPLGIPVTERAYLLGHSVETNERFYSHMRTESIEDIKTALNGANKGRHTQAHRNIIDFPQNKNPQNAVSMGISGTFI